jgi:hypothetical protein
MAAQIVPSANYWVVDPCGGRPAWISSTVIVEDSPASGSPCSYTSTKTGGAPIYDLKSVTQTGGSWSHTPTIATLTSNTLRSNLGYAAYCSIGNPDSDGTHLAALIQGPLGNSCTSSADPGAGTSYDLLVCNSVTTLTGGAGGTCSVVLSSNSSTGALLDPHIDGNHVYVSERNNTSIGNAWPTWSVDDVPVTWGNPPTFGTATLYYPLMAGYWPLFGESAPCEQFYKATSFQHLTNGNTRIFTQANQVSNYPKSTSTCVNWGINGYGQSGLFYFDLTNAPSGANFTQIYPLANVASPGTSQCLITVGSSTPTACYGEFPIVFPNGDHLFMLFIGTTTTPARLIVACAATLGPCKVQFPSENLVMDLGTNTQSPSPSTNATAILPQTNFQMPGSSLNTTFLDGGILSGNWGNCGHLSMNFASQDMVCTISTNIVNANNVPASQTTVFNLAYAGSILYPTTMVNNNITISGKVTIK